MATNSRQNRTRGVSALRRTGPKRHLEMSKVPLPEPVLDPAQKSQVVVDEHHGLWAFFAKKDSPLMTPEDTARHGRAWVVEELRRKSWNDLHCLWWSCVKELNIIATQEYERARLKAGYGELENRTRVRVVRQTMKAIKHTLTERYYAWDDARRFAKKTNPDLSWEGKGNLFRDDPKPKLSAKPEPKLKAKPKATSSEPTSLEFTSSEHEEPAVNVDRTDEHSPKPSKTTNKSLIEDTMSPRAH